MAPPAIEAITSLKRKVSHLSAIICVHRRLFVTTTLKYSDLEYLIFYFNSKTRAAVALRMLMEVYGESAPTDK